MSSTQSVACSLIASEVEVGSLGTYQVPPPSVRTALLVLAALQEGDMDLLRDACQAWLPRRLVDSLWGRAVSAPSRLRCIGRLLSVGIPERHAAKTDEAQETARDDGWHLTLALYRQTYAVSLQDVLSEPWPVFLHQAYLMHEVRARQRLDMAMAAGVGFGGDKRAWRALEREAGLHVPSRTEKPWERAGISRKEWVQQKKQKVYQTKTRILRHWREQQGEA